MATTNGFHHESHELELAGHLSTNASVHLAQGGSGSTVRTRWSTFEAPEFKYIVDVATEEDVALTVWSRAQYPVLAESLC